MEILESLDTDELNKFIIPIYKYFKNTNKMYKKSWPKQALPFTREEILFIFKNR